MKPQRSARLALCAVAACVLLYFFPLFRIRKLGSLATSHLSSTTQSDSKARASIDSPPDIATFIDTLWTERLPKAVGNAATVDDVLAMAATDADRAQKEFGRKVGLGGPTFLFLRGRGRIQSVNQDECLLVINGQTQRVSLAIGILFGNAVRDATGLVSLDEFPNSQDFNRLSAELNQRCESEVIEPIRDQLVTGAVVEFAGCCEVRNSVDLDPLKLIPVRLKLIETVESTE